MLSEAIRSFERIGDLPHALGHMGNAYARNGETGTALSIVEKLKRHVEQSGIGRYEIALIYAGLPQNDNAFDWLEKALRVRDKGVTYIRLDPCIDRLRSDPRLQDLERLLSESVGNLSLLKTCVATPMHTSVPVGHVCLGN